MVQVEVTPTDGGPDLLEFRLEPVRSGFRLKAELQHCHAAQRDGWPRSNSWL